MSEILDKNGVPTPTIPAYTALGKNFPFRVLDLKRAKNEPAYAFVGTLNETRDRGTLSLVLLTALAKDLYSRMPEGSAHFKDIIDGLMVASSTGDSIPLIDLLEQT